MMVGALFVVVAWVVSYTLLEAPKDRDHKGDERDVPRTTLQSTTHKGSFRTDDPEGLVPVAMKRVDRQKLL